MQPQGTQDDESNPLAKLKTGAKLVSCRYCKGDHWSKQCPHKDQLEALSESLEKQDKADNAEMPRAKPGKYVAPSLRDGARRPGESMQSARRGTDPNASSSSCLYCLHRSRLGRRLGKECLQFLPTLLLFLKPSFRGS